MVTLLRVVLALARAVAAAFYRGALKASAGGVGSRSSPPAVYGTEVNREAAMRGDAQSWQQSLGTALGFGYHRHDSLGRQTGLRPVMDMAWGKLARCSKASKHGP